MILAISLAAAAATTAATLVSRYLVTVSPRQRELRLRGKAFTHIVARAMCRASDINSATLVMQNGGLLATIEHTRANATIALSPRFIELSGSEVRIGFEVHNLSIDPHSWWLGLFVGVAQALLGTQRLLRLGLGAKTTDEGALVLATPVDSVPWVGRLLAMAGSESQPRKIPAFVDNGDVVIGLRDDR